MPLLWVLRDVLGTDGHEIRLRHRAMRRLHGACRRQAGALLSVAGRCDRRSRHYDDRRHRRHAGGRQSAESLARSRSRCSAAIASRVRSCRRRRCSPARRIPTTPISTRRWREISAAAAPMCASATRSSAPRATARHRGPSCNPNERPRYAASRRRLLKGGLGGRIAAGIPPSAACGERTGAGARQSGGPVCAQRLHPHRSRRQDHARHAAGRDGAGRLYRGRDDSRRRTRRRLSRRWCWNMRRPTTSSTPIPIFGIQATGNSNSIRAFWKPLRRPARRRGRCWCRRRRNNGRSMPASCSAANGRSFTLPSGRTLGYGDLADAAGAIPVPQGSAAQGPERLHADRQAAQALRYARARSTARSFTASTRCCPA